MSHFFLWTIYLHFSKEPWHPYVVLTFTLLYHKYKLPIFRSFVLSSEKKKRGNTNIKPYHITFHQEKREASKIRTFLLNNKFIIFIRLISSSHTQTYGHREDNCNINEFFPSICLPLSPHREANVNFTLYRYYEATYKIYTYLKYLLQRKQSSSQFTPFGLH